MRRLFVLELNEVPLRLLRWHAERRPESAIAQLLAHSEIGQSVADEPLPRELYPSQSWASLAMGVPFSEHGVFWYGDPKPEEFPLYWQAAASAGLTTGIVGTLHSSPQAKMAASDSMLFAVPDAFASEPSTIPARLSRLQEFSLDMTRANSRVVVDTSPWRSYASAVGGLVQAGLSVHTARRLARLAVDVGRAKVPRERLRVGQFHLWADQFDRLARKQDADLSVLFSNHVASAMHRYWFTVFPDDWDEPVYDEAWVRRFEHEIPYALESVDIWLSRWMEWVQDTDRTLLVLSSMGQTGGAPVDTSETEAIVVTDAARFAEALSLPRVHVGNGMVPQVSFVLDSPAAAESEAQRLRELSISGRTLGADVSDATLTISYSCLNGLPEKFQIGDVWVSRSEAGLSTVEVSEHRAAIHDPLGSVIVYNSPTASLPADPFNYLTIAPAILQSLGLEALEHHVETEVVF